MNKRIIEVRPANPPHPVMLRLECGHERGWKAVPPPTVGKLAKCRACTRAAEPVDDGEMSEGEWQAYGRWM